LHEDACVLAEVLACHDRAQDLLDQAQNLLDAATHLLDVADSLMPTPPGPPAAQGPALASIRS